MAINFVGTNFVGKNFVSTRNKQGRPKKECAMMTTQLQAKRSVFCDNIQAQLTGLHLLYARKQLSQQQFIAGCYYTDLSQKLRRSMGGICGPMSSTITKIDHLPGAKASFVMNQSALCSQNAIHETLGYVHFDALKLVQRILLTDAMESASIVKELPFTQLGIFRKALDVIYNYLEQNAVSLEAYEKIA